MFSEGLVGFASTRVRESRHVTSTMSDMSEAKKRALADKEAYLAERAARRGARTVTVIAVATRVLLAISVW